jgi:hypothetical protein
MTMTGVWAYISPLLAMVATMIMGKLASIPMKLRPFVAVAAGILLQLFANGGLNDGLQVQDFVDGLLVGLAAVGLYSGAKNVKEHLAAK